MQSPSRSSPRQELLRLALDLAAAQTAEVDESVGGVVGQRFWERAELGEADLTDGHCPSPGRRKPAFVGVGRVRIGGRRQAAAIDRELAVVLLRRFERQTRRLAFINPGRVNLPSIALAG